MRESSSLLVRGILGVLVGLAALLWPGITLAALVVVFAAYALLDGIANLITGFLRSRTHQRAWPFFVHGLVGVAAAALAFFYPRLTAFTLVLFVAAWAIVTGAMQIAGAIRFRHEITGEWLLVVSGALSIAFGLLVFIFPGAGALTIAWMFGAFAASTGIVLIALAIRLRSVAPTP
jgi:uncharacterized membrane protein HdeD (DUF308 family)